MHTSPSTNQGLVRFFVTVIIGVLILAYLGIDADAIATKIIALLKALWGVVSDLLR